MHRSLLELHTQSHSPLFLHGTDIHRDLHSFPTRRSSDLGTPTRGRRVGRRVAGKPSRGVAAPAGRLTGNSRSEEHTSELQSRPHLVCRLVLEKKKASDEGASLEHTRTRWRPTPSAGDTGT